MAGPILPRHRPLGSGSSVAPLQTAERRKLYYRIGISHILTLGVDANINENGESCDWVA